MNLKTDAHAWISWKKSKEGYYINYTIQNKSDLSDRSGFASQAKTPMDAALLGTLRVISWVKHQGDTLEQFQRGIKIHLAERSWEIADFTKALERQIPDSWKDSIPALQIYYKGDKFKITQASKGIFINDSGNGY